MAAAVGALFLAALLPLAATATVSSALPGRIGEPATTAALAARPPALQPDTRIAVVGDVGTGAPDALAVAGDLAEAGQPDPFDGLILLGDNVYPDGEASRLDATVFDPYGPVLDAGAELLPVIGNHDEGFAAEQVAAFGMPGRWYAQHLGDVLFIGLDSTMAEDPAQLAWLQQTLATADAPWIVAAMHHPPFSAGVHGSDEDTRESFVPLFEQYGVDLVLAGHDHDYQRSVPIDGITYVVSGAGAKVRSTGSADFTAASAAVLHFVELGVWPDRLEITAVSLDGVFDKAIVYPHMPAMLSADAIPIGGLLMDGVGSGLRLAALAIAAWAVVTLVTRFLPAALAVRAERILAVASTMTVLTLLGGLGLVAVTLLI